MNYELYYRALERAVADILDQFEETPDLFMRETDLHAAFFHALQQHDALTAVGLVHREYPTFHASEGPSGGTKGFDRAYYDVAVLDPSFVRGHELAVVTNVDVNVSMNAQVTPLLAAVCLRLIGGFTPALLDGLKRDARDLARSKRAIRRCYLVICCRHWDLDNEIRKALETIQRWADSYPYLSIVVVQSYYDDIGRVFGGQYLNTWGYMAPLLPLDPSAHPLLARIRSRLAG